MWVDNALVLNIELNVIKRDRGSLLRGGTTISPN